MSHPVDKPRREKRFTFFDYLTFFVKKWGLALPASMAQAHRGINNFSWTIPRPTFISSITIYRHIQILGSIVYGAGWNAPTCEVRGKADRPCRSSCLAMLLSLRCSASKSDTAGSWHPPKSMTANKSPIISANILLIIESKWLPIVLLIFQTSCFFNFS